MKEAIQAFERYLERRYPGSSTEKHYVSDLRQFQACVDKPPREVTRADIDKFIAAQVHAGHCPTTVNRRLASLHTFFEFLAYEADDDNWANPVVWQQQRVKQGQPLPRDLRDREVEQLFAVIDHPRDQLLFSLMCRAGLRVGEVVNLRRSDFLPAAAGEPGARLRVCGKGHKERIVPLTAQLTEQWEAWLAQRPAVSSEAVFVTRRRAGISVRGIQDRLAHYCRQAGLEASCHQLRHTFGRWMAEGHMPVTSLAKLLGHSQVTTTQIYIAGAGVDVRADYEAALNRLDAECPGSPLPPAATPQPVARVPAPPEPDAGTGGSARPAPQPTPRELDLSRYWQDLPAWLVEALQSYITRQQRNWKPSQVTHHTQQRLKALRHVWRWLLENQALDSCAGLRRQHLDAYIAQRLQAQVAASTINRELRDLLSFLRFVQQQGQAISPGVFRVERPKEGKPLPRFLTEQAYAQLEAQVLAATAAGTADNCLDRAWFYVLAHAGLRVGELCDLQWEDLDLDRQRLLVRDGKGRRDRAVPLTPTTVRALQAYQQGHALAGTGRVFTWQGQPLRADVVRHRLQRYGKAVGVEVSPHRLRHTLATRLVNAGMKITSLQRLLGHEKLSTTMIYAHVHDETVTQDFQHAMARLEAVGLPQPVAQEDSTSLAQAFFSHPNQPVSVAREFPNCV